MTKAAAATNYLEERAAAAGAPHAATGGQTEYRRRRADREHDLFATIVEDAFSEIIVFDAESLEIILANRSARNNLGYGSSELNGLSVAEINPEFSPIRLKDIYRPILEGETTKIVVHTIHRRRNGSTYPVEVHSRVSQFAGRPMIFQIAIDQTEIKRTQALASLTSTIERDAAEAKDSRVFLVGLLARLSRQFGSQIAHAYVWNKQDARLESSGLWHVESAAKWQAEFQRATAAMALPSGISLPGQVHSRKQAIVVNNLGDNPLFARGFPLDGMPISAGFAIPVLAGSEVAVVLEFFFVQRLSMEIWPELTDAIGEQVSRLYERKCAEESANESRERFDAAVNGAAVGLWDYNYKSGIFYLSPRCRDILQIAEGVLPPTWKVFGERIHPEDVRRTAAAMRAHMINRTPYDVEYRYAVSEDHYIWLHSRAQGVWDGTGAIIRTAGTIEDISAEKEGENVQREVLACIAASDDTATKVTRALNRVCTYLDLETAIVSHVADDRYDVHYRSSRGAGPALNASIPLSETICSDVYSADTLQTFPNLENSPVATHPARAQHAIEAYIGITVFVKGVRFGTLSFYGPHPRGAFNEMEMAMVRLLARWIGEEIGRESDVAELIENDVRISAKLASVADALLTVDHNGLIEDANPAAARMFSWAPEELRGMSISALLPTAKAFSNPDGRLMPVNLRQDVAIRKDGRRLAILLTVSEIHLGNRTIYTVAISDLTAVKQAEVAKGEFVSTVSHELRTPLTSIRGAIDLIVSQITGPLSPETAALAEVAQRNCDRLLRLVNDILSTEKLESGQFEMTLQPIDVGVLLRDAITANALYAAKFDASFELSVADNLPMVIADGERLMQVMANLLSNAAKFTRPGTEVFIRAVRYGKYVRMSVRDQGTGIPERIRNRIFEKFMQGDSVTTRGCEGSGLGLCIARQMVELMNGEIGFETQKEAGTTFHVDLPIADIAGLTEFPASQQFEHGKKG